MDINLANIWLSISLHLPKNESGHLPRRTLDLLVLTQISASGSRKHAKMSTHQKMGIQERYVFTLCDRHVVSMCVQPKVPGY